MKNKTKSFTVSNAGLLAIAFFLLAATAHAQINPTLRPKSAAESIPDGYSVIDGDIVMPAAEVKAILSGQKKLSDVSDATYIDLLWTNGIVPFEFDVNVSAPNQSAAISAMAVLESAANVHFEQCALNSCPLLSNYVHIQNSAMNNSQVGMVGFRQNINIFNWNTQYIIVHEMLHALGFYHEQTRADRDTYIQINCPNLQGGCNGDIYNANFKIPILAVAYGNYDFDSVMHYDDCAFSNDCPPGGTCACTNKVITVLPPNQNQQTLIGQRTHLSVLDRATVSFLYPAADWRFYDCTYPVLLGTGTFLHPFADPIQALIETPPGGTLWVLKNCSFPVRIYNQQVTVKTAPGVTASFGN